MKVGICIVARLASTRLPRKVLADVAGAPMLVRLVRHVVRSKAAEVTVLCTSKHPDDRPLIDVAESLRLPWIAGSEKNVLQRFDDAIRQFGLDTVVRVTGDNPLTDPEVMDEMIATHHSQGAEYTYTPDPPRGTRSEIISVSTVRTLLHRAVDPDSSEYMTDMLRRPDVFRVVAHRVSNPSWVRPEYRLTVDTREDLELVRHVYGHFEGRDDISLTETISFLDRRPDLLALNAALEPRVAEAWVNTKLR